MLNCWCITWPVGFKRLSTAQINQIYVDKIIKIWATVLYEKNIIYKKWKGGNCKWLNFFIHSTVPDIIPLIMHRIFGDSLLLGYDVVSLGNHFSVFRDLFLKGWKVFILVGHFDAWRKDHYACYNFGKRLTNEALHIREEENHLVSATVHNILLWEILFTYKPFQCIMLVHPIPVNGTFLKLYMTESLRNLRFLPAIFQRLGESRT